MFRNRSKPLAGLSLLLVVLVTLSSCSKRQKFDFAVPEESPSVVRDVEIRTHTLNRREKEGLFFANTRRFSEKYEVVQIHINNMDNKKYILAGKNVGLKLESYSNVKDRLSKGNLWTTLLSGLLTALTDTHDRDESEDEKYARRKRGKRFEKDMKAKIIKRDSQVTIHAGLDYTGLLIVRRERFSREVELKLVDSKNEAPLYFDLLL